MDTLGKRLKSLRKKKGVNQTDLAEAVGLQQSDISKLERGDIASTPKLWRLARELDCSPAWLEDGQEEGVPWGQAPTTQGVSSAIKTIAEAVQGSDEDTRDLIAANLAQLCKRPHTSPLVGATIESILKEEGQQRKQDRVA